MISKKYLYFIKKTIYNKEMKLALIFSFVVSFMLFFFGPIEMYITNKAEFWFDIYTIIPPVFIQTVIMAISMYLFYLLMFLLSPAINRLMIILGFITFIILYVHGIYFLGGLNVLDGRGITFSYKYLALSICVTIFFIVLMFGILLKKGRERTLKIIKYILLVLLFVMVVTIITEFIIYKGYVRKKEVKYTTYDNITTFSEEKNVIVLLLDYVDAKEFKYAMEQYRDWKNEDVFCDFTFFNNVVGGYPLTYFSIPLILSGKRYTYQECFPDYLNRSLKDSKLLNDLGNEDYLVDIYEGDIGKYYILDDSIANRIDNIDSEKIVIDSYPEFLSQLNTLVIYRYLPYYLKKEVDLSVVNLSETAKTISENEAYTWENDAFYKKLDNEMHTSGKKVFKFIHLKGGHPYFYYDRNLELKESDTSIEAYHEQLLGCCTLVEKFLRFLKSNGVYDNSTIVIMADHGRNYNPSNGEYVWEFAKNPLFMIKRINEHKINVDYSDKPLSYLDMGEMMSELLMDTGIKEADVKELFLGITSSEKREFLTYTWTGEMTFAMKGGTFKVYEQSLDINEPLNDTGRTYVNQWDW